MVFWFEVDGALLENCEVTNVGAQSGFSDKKPRFFTVKLENKIMNQHAQTQFFLVFIHYSYE